MPIIDLNCDMGEAFGNYSMPNDDILMDYITSANIACGFHAGDPEVMQYTVKKAVEKGVTIGAHPGLPDLQGFGRREMKITANETYAITLYQIGALHAFAKAAGGTLHHVKPHGALYNMAAKDAALAKAIVAAVYDFDAGLILYALANSEMIKAATAKGLASCAEVFADRTYTDEGQLTPRSQPDALLTSDEAAVQQVLQMVEDQTVTTTSGKIISLKADTVCIHGDGAHAVPFAQKLRQALQQKGITVKAPIL